MLLTETTNGNGKTEPMYLNVPIQAPTDNYRYSIENMHKMFYLQKRFHVKF